MTDAAAPAAGPAGNPTPDDSTSNKKQKREVTVRAPPAGCNWQSVPKDGNCLFHAVGAGLRWLKHQPSSFHHLDLRARVADHLDRHKTDYEPAWAADGKPGPDGKPMDGWSDFVTAVGTPGSFSGEVELKALCRLFSIRVVVIPADPRWAVCSYGKAKQKDVVAVLFQDSHFDFVKPDKEYPSEVSTLIKDPCGGFLVGGMSEACSGSSSSTRGKGLSQACSSSCGSGIKHAPGMSIARTGSAASTRKQSRVRDPDPAVPVIPVVRKGVASTFAEFDQLLDDEVAAPVKVARKTGRPRLVQWCQAGLARCHLCPFQIPCPDNHTRRPQSALRDHYARCHDGMCPSGLHSGEEMPTTVAALSADQEAAWRCRFCS